MDVDLHEYERAILPYIKEYKTVEELSRKSGLDAVKVGRGLQWLSNKGLIVLNYEEHVVIDLDENGRLNKERGLPEKRCLHALQDGSWKSLAQIAKEGLDQEEVLACIGLLKKKNAIEIKKDKGEVALRITEDGKAQLQQKSGEETFLQRAFPIALNALSERERGFFEQLRARKKMFSVQTKKMPVFSLTASGEKIASMGISASGGKVSRLTSEMIRDGSWRKAQFRAYDVRLPVPKVHGGRRHPLAALIEAIRDVFIEMGFHEMKGPWVETSFWCMDSMWIPQDHPARDVQDTFYLPYSGKLPNKELVMKVKACHETGGKTTSKGYQYPWNPEVAKRLLMRTHTTATTFRSLFEHGVAQKQSAKYFSIGRIFRNEAIDATHLPEFHQVEGFVMDDGLTLGHLMGFIKEFYGRMGIHQIRFKPTYNPYTESSLEALYYDKKRGAWLELINSGIFRPESLAPFGIKKPIVAWGLGVERLAMVLYHSERLRDLLGPSVDIEWLRNYSTVARFD